MFSIYVYIYMHLFIKHAECAERFKIILKLFLRYNILYNIFIK